MSENLFLGLVLASFGLFSAVLTWAQITTPTLAQLNAQAKSDEAPSANLASAL